jgi:hypothetical protein
LYYDQGVEAAGNVSGNRKDYAKYLRRIISFNPTGEHTHTITMIYEQESSENLLRRYCISGLHVYKGTDFSHSKREDKHCGLMFLSSKSLMTTFSILQARESMLSWLEVAKIEAREPFAFLNLEDVNPQICHRS